MKKKRNLTKKDMHTYYDKDRGKQDKVNYAVSEKEDTVTDVTILTRMMGFTAMHWAATGLYLAVHIVTA